MNADELFEKIKTTSVDIHITGPPVRRVHVKIGEDMEDDYGEGEWECVICLTTCIYCLQSYNCQLLKQQRRWYPQWAKLAHKLIKIALSETSEKEELDLLNKLLKVAYEDMKNNVQCDLL